MKDGTYHFRYHPKCHMCNYDEFDVLGKRLNSSQGINPRSKTGVTTTVVRCKKCGLIYANPLPIPDQISDHYDVIPEEYWKPHYFELSDNYFQTEIDWLKKNSGFIGEEPKSLDIGAGLGKQMIALQKEGFDVYGLEPSEAFFERAISKMNIPKSKLKLSSIEDAQYAPESFDFISFGVVLEHIYFPAEALKKALGWLKPDGIIHIEVPSSKWLINKLINVVYRIRGMDYVGNISPMHPPYHLTEFSIDSFKLNGEINGYYVKDFHYYVCETYLPWFIDPILRQIMKATNTGMQLCVWLGKK